MSIRIREALLLDYAKEMKLIAGEDGLDNLITTVGILDHEIIEKQLDVFQKGEFVISTLSVARDDDKLVFFAVKELIKEKVAGLAIKSVYYADLPQYIKDYANEHSFPIFVFDSIFIEHLINTISNGLQSRLLHEAFEAKLETIFKGMLSKHLIKQLAHELNSDFLDFQQVIYCKEKRYVSDNNIIGLIERYLRNKDRCKHHGVYKFRTGIIIIMTFNDNINSHIDIDFSYLLNQIGLNKEDFIIGKSQTYHSLENIDKPIKESYYAYKAAEITNTNMQDYSQIGIYQLLIPLMNDPWAIRYSKSVIEPIINYDLQFDAHLYETVKIYFRLGCNTKLTAEELFQHKNTILYRLKKVKELVGPFINEQDFTEQLSIALKIHEAIYQSPDYNT